MALKLITTIHVHGSHGDTVYGPEVRDENGEVVEVPGVLTELPAEVEQQILDGPHPEYYFAAKDLEKHSSRTAHEDKQDGDKPEHKTKAKGDKPEV